MEQTMNAPEPEDVDDRIIGTELREGGDDEENSSK